MTVSTHKHTHTNTHTHTPHITYIPFICQDKHYFDSKLFRRKKNVFLSARKGTMCEVASFNRLKIELLLSPGQIRIRYIARIDTTFFLSEGRVF